MSGDTATTAPSTITMLARLSKAVVRRTPESVLGMKLRHFIVVLTEQGAEAHQRAETAREAVEDDVLHALDAGERETLRLLLVKALEG